MSKRLLTEKEIDDVLSFITPNKKIPKDTAQSIVNIQKEGIACQLRNQLIYPECIPELRNILEKQYVSSLVQPGESVGVVCAQSIGEKQTQMTLNSVDWDEKILYSKDDDCYVSNIGEFIDNLLDENFKNIEYIPKNRTEYLKLGDGYCIPSCDENGKTGWYKIEAITRHLPVGKLVKVKTEYGRCITATQSKSFLVWDGIRFSSTNGSDLNIGDYVPTTSKLSMKTTNTYHSGMALDYELGFMFGLYISYKFKDPRYNDFMNNFFNTHPHINIDFFKFLCDVHYSNRTKIPLFVYSSNLELIRGLLDGFTDSNCVYLDKVEVCSTDSELICSISFLFYYFGIVGKIINRCPLSILVLNKKDVDKVIAAKNKTMDVVLDRIVSIEYVNGSTPFVYDLTVEHTRNFQLFNGLNCRDTFHKAGQSEKGMTAGVPRFQELLNATKGQKIVNSKIYFKDNAPTLIAARSMVGHNIVSLTLDDLCMDVKTGDIPDQPWYEPYCMLYDKTIPEYENYKKIEFVINIGKLYEFKLTLIDIADVINNEYEDVFCVCSPLQSGIIHVFVDVSNITFPKNRIVFIDADNKEDIYIEECVLYNLKKIQICGLENVSEIYYIKENNEWIVETEGGCLKDLLSNDMTDSTRTINNNLWDIYNTLGIEAARSFLISEFMSIMDGINECHPKILVDRMTHNGTIESITRYAMRKADAGPFGKASFEESLDNFLKASISGSIESTNGVSASVICGKRARMGTGAMELKMDLGRLPQTLSDEVVERKNVVYVSKKGIRDTRSLLPNLKKRLALKNPGYE